MKIRFLCVQKGAEKYFNLVAQIYTEKIGRFCSFEFEVIKPKGVDRAQADRKRAVESDQILKKIDARDWVVLFDELGKTMVSKKFSENLVENLERGKNSIVFVIGGAFGASEELKSRADQTIKLSDLTMNHLIAATVGLEQIYRALTIWKNMPYHNE